MAYDLNYKYLLPLITGTWQGAREWHDAGLWQDDIAANTFSYLTSAYVTHYEKGSPVNHDWLLEHEQARVVNAPFELDYNYSDLLVTTNFKLGNDFFERVDQNVLIVIAGLTEFSQSYSFGMNKMRYLNQLNKEVVANDAQAIDGNLVTHFAYAPAKDQQVNKPWSDLDEFGINYAFDHQKGTELTVNYDLAHQYSLSSLVIAEPFTLDYLHDEDAVVIEPPNDDYIQHTDYTVLRIVNIVNIVTLPDRTPIKWTDLTISRDIESFAWTITVNIANQASIDAIKPSGLTTKEIEVDINGELFNFFIAKTNTSITNKAKQFKVTGYSYSKLLDAPYSAKKSERLNTTATAAPGITHLLIGTGFTSVFEIPDWVIPQGIFSYQDLSPMAAIKLIANAAGAVIEPDTVNKTITIKSYYPDAPWNWSTANIDRSLFESQMFTIDTQWLPKESADSVYIHGDAGGVFAKIQINGSGGVSTLPTVIDRLITDTIAAKERGKVEIAKNRHTEIVPMSTYVDENGIIMPSELCLFDDGVATWRGLIASNSISITRNGTAIVQSIQVIKHHD